MRKSPLCVLFLASLLPAQIYGIPDNNPKTGTGHVVPFGEPKPGGYSNTICQTLILASDLNYMTGKITGLAFAPLGPDGSTSSDFLQITMVPVPVSQRTFSTDFAKNRGSGTGVRVLTRLSGRSQFVGDSWNEIGL